MSFQIPEPTPLSFFASLVSSDDEFPLLETAASLAQDHEPQLDVQQVLDEVDVLLARLRERVPHEADDLRRLEALNHFFFGEMGFGGNVNDYYAPDNSYLHQVLRKRRGIPISLAVVWLELARGLGLQANGVGFPGHFMVKVTLPEGQVVMDPFTGQSLSREDLSERLEPYVPAQRGVTPDVLLTVYLRHATPREIIARMLRNLKEIHRSEQDWIRLLAVQNRLILLLPQAWAEWRDRGLAHAELGSVAQALEDLQTYLQHEPDAPDRVALTERIEALRRTGPAT